MSIAFWGSKKFDASSKKVYTFDGFTNSAALNLESQENEGGKAFTAIRGIETEKLGFALKLHRDYVNVYTEIKSWKALMTAKKAYPLYIGKKKYGTLPWLLASVDVSEVKIGPYGAMISATVELGFEELYKLKPPSQNTTSSSSGSGSASSTRTTTNSSGSSSASGSKTTTSTDAAAKKAAANNIKATIKANSYLESMAASYKTVLNKLRELASWVISSKAGAWSQAKATLVSTLTKMISQYLLVAPVMIPDLQDLRDGIKSGYGGSGSSASWGPNVPDLIALAKEQLGKPYVLGAKGPNKFDCSGFVYWCLKNIGVSLSYMTAATWAGATAYTKVSSMNDLKSGDICCFSGSAPGKGHVGIYLGNGTMIDASSSDGKVRISSPLKSSSYWRSHFICGRRWYPLNY